MSIKLVTGPATEPIVLTDAKKHLRVDDDYDDDLITDLIVAAREYCEDFTHRAFIQQTWNLFLDHFPGRGEHNQGFADFGVFGDAALGIGIPPVGYTYNYQSEVYFRAGAIIIPKPPLISIGSIKYLDNTGTLQTLDPSQYQIDTASEPARVAPVANSNWPLTELSIRAPILNGVTINFDCGYGDATAVPASIRAAMKLMIGHWYENRMAVIAGSRYAAFEVPDAADALLWRNKVVYFA